MSLGGTANTTNGRNCKQNEDAPGSPGGVSRLLLDDRFVLDGSGCHGLDPWRFTLSANASARDPTYQKRA